MNVRREDTILRISKVPKNYSMGYTFYMRGVKGVHINCTPKLFMIGFTIHVRKENTNLLYFRFIL